MYTPHTYPIALLMMLFSMLCWGSWANTQKIDKINRGDSSCTIGVTCGAFWRARFFSVLPSAGRILMLL